ncbi:MAG TPA: HAD-IA family hydrolase [Terriglobia bacterium]|nr:HAD-IA family hydrolase [Terriglobia bacterium]
MIRGAPLPRQTLGDIRLVIFDLDGTLIDSKQDLVASVNAMRQAMGLGLLPEEVIASYVGRGVATLIRRALANGAPDEVGDETVSRATQFFLDYYWIHKLDHTVAYSGVAEALDHLAGRKLAVLTNKPVVFSRAILADLGLAPHFCFIYGGNSFAAKKPDPAGVIRLMADTGSTPAQTMIVGDSDTDVLTGRNAGVWTCGVNYGLAPQTLESSPPDVIIDDLRELPRLLDGQSGAGGRRRSKAGGAVEPKARGNRSGKAPIKRQGQP